MKTKLFNNLLRFLTFTIILIYLVSLNYPIFSNSTSLDNFLARDLGDIVGNKLFAFFDKIFWNIIGLGGVVGLLKSNGDFRERVTMVGTGLISI